MNKDRIVEKNKELKGINRLRLKDKIGTLGETMLESIHSHIQSVLFRTTPFGYQNYSNVLVFCSYMNNVMENSQTFN